MFEERVLFKYMHIGRRCSGRFLGVGKNFRIPISYCVSLIVVMDLWDSFRDGNDLNLRQMDNISDAVLLVCRCTWAERTITTQ